MSEDPSTTEGSRPLSATEWEAEQNKAAVDAADSQSSDLAGLITSGEHQSVALKELAEAGKSIRDSAQAVERLTRESLIADNKRFRRRNAVLVSLLVVLIGLISIMLGRELWVVGPQRDQISNVVTILEDCTTAGPHTPTPADPTTGHRCYDQAQANQGKAIATIVDADGNGKIDTQEILAAIKRFEVFLGTPQDQ